MRKEEIMEQNRNKWAKKGMEEEKNNKKNLKTFTSHLAKRRTRSGFGTHETESSQKGMMLRMCKALRCSLRFLVCAKTPHVVT